MHDPNTVCEAMTMLRRDLLQDVRVALAGPPPATISERLAALGATVMEVPDTPEESDAEQWARTTAPLHALLFDARPAFGGGGAERLRISLEAAWRSIRAVAIGALIPAPDPSKISLIAPVPGAGTHAAAARAGLENLARTLSVEWARYEITVTALHPGDSTSEEELAELVSFLVSRAGSYLSGCRLELGRLSAAQSG
jgi:NAD(P)-dependent dehydrogenase (short-subunit alcohol dehydrogenase family)